MSGCLATIAAGSDTTYPADLFAELHACHNLKQLEVKFSDSMELSSSDIQQLAALTHLSSLALSNVSLPASTDMSSITQLMCLQQLSLVHHSKVAALVVGDSHLAVLGQLTGLTELELQGRMCSATDQGLMALGSLVGLRNLSISWVPWQSQITQARAG
jgi:Leucine-rich repeat (LRR) protein